jgi:voltage-gated potassium channel Kch
MAARVEQRVTGMLATLTLRKAVALIVGVAATLAVIAAVLQRLIDPAFTTFGNALWWAVATVTTVGYGVPPAASSVRNPENAIIGIAGASCEADARTRTGDPFITREGRVREARPLAGMRGHYFAAN